MNEVKVERSMVVAGRVDVVKLAEIMAGLTADKFNIRTLSLLLSYCVEISHSAMEQNSLLTTRFDGPLKAFNFLSDAGILSRHVQVKNMKKMQMAQGLDEIRQMGGMPSIEAPDVYNTLHNRHSTQVPDTHIITKSKVDEAVKVFKDLEAQELIKKSKAPRVIHGSYNLDENGAIISKHKVIPKLECPAPATDIPDEAARTSKSSLDIPRQKTNEEIQADFDRIKQKDDDLMAALDSIGKPVD